LKRSIKLTTNTPDQRLTRLEDLPNIGKAIAADLRSLSIHTPGQLAETDPLATFQSLASVMGNRHDPCVLYTLMAVAHFQKSGEVLPWWRFAAQGKQLLQSKIPGNRQG
jgi:DNA transformation protein